MGKYSKAFSIKKQFQSPNCQRCQGQSRTMKKFIFLELFLRIIEDEKWNLFVKLGQLRTPTKGDCNERICKNGRPSDDCWNWQPGNNHKKTDCIDCDKKYPGCIDKDGNMYRHGDIFVPKGDCNRCNCDRGKVAFFTRMGCPGHGRGRG